MVHQGLAETLRILWSGVAKGSLKFIKKNSKDYRVLYRIDVEEAIEYIAGLVRARQGGDDEEDHDGALSEWDGPLEEGAGSNKGKMQILLIWGLLLVIRRRVEFYNEEVKALEKRLKLKPVVEEDDEESYIEEVGDDDGGQARRRGPARGAKRTRKQSTTSVVSAASTNGGSTTSGSSPRRNGGEWDFGEIGPEFFDNLLANGFPSPRVVGEDHEFLIPSPPKKKKGKGRRREGGYMSDADVLDMLIEGASRPDQNLLIEPEIPLNRLHLPESDDFYAGTNVDPVQDMLNFEREMFGDGSISELVRGGTRVDQPPAAGDANVSIPGAQGSIQSRGSSIQERLERTPTRETVPEANANLELAPIHEGSQPARKKAKKGKRVGKKLILDQEIQIPSNKEIVKLYTGPKDPREWDEFLRIEKNKTQLRIIPRAMTLTGLQFINNAGRAFGGSVLRGMRFAALEGQSRGIKEGRALPLEGRNDVGNASGDSSGGHGPVVKEEPMELDSLEGAGGVGSRVERTPTPEVIPEVPEVSGQDGGIPEQVMPEQEEIHEDQPEQIIMNGTTGSFKFFTDLCPPGKPRGFAVRLFTKLLRMQKERKIRIEQEESFGPIKIFKL